MKIFYIVFYSFVIILISLLVFYNNNYYALDRINYVSFTFDDGPSKYTKDIASLLNSYGYSATFFMIGSKLKDDISVSDYIESMGSEVGMHGWEHILVNNDEYKALNEFNSNYLLLYNYSTNKNYLYRPSYGVLDKNTAKYINKPIILWNKDTLDWSVKDRNIIANYILDNITEYDIFLMHDIYEETFEALKIALPVLKNRGYKVLSVSSLSRARGCYLKNKNVYYNLKECL